MASIDPISSLFPSLNPGLAAPLSGTSLFEQALQQAAQKPATSSQAGAARLQWLGAQWDKQQTLFGLFSSPGNSSSTDNLDWMMRDMTAPGAPFGPAKWVTEIERVLGGMDPQVTALQQQMDFLARPKSGSSLLPF